MTVPPDLAQLCCAVRVALGTATPADLETAPQWRRLAPLAEAHRLTTILDRHPARPDALRTSAAHHRLRALDQVRELARISMAFHAQRIRLLAYKGVVLSQEAYGSPLERVCSDIDVAIHPEDADVALHLLCDLGYETHYNFSARAEACFREMDGDYQVAHVETGALVELHCRVSSRRFVIDLETADLWAHHRTMSIGGCELAIPGEEDALIILAVHGAKHRWRRLEWIAAFGVLLQRMSAGAQERAHLRAMHLGAGRALRLASHLAVELLRVQAGESLKSVAAADTALERLFADSIAALQSTTSLEDQNRDDTRKNLAFNLRILERWEDRARYAARWAFVPTPEDWGALGLPERAFSLYSIIRPVRLLKTYARTSWFE